MTESRNEESGTRGRHDKEIEHFLYVLGAGAVLFGGISFVQAEIVLTVVFGMAALLAFNLGLDTRRQQAGGADA